MMDMPDTPALHAELIVLAAGLSSAAAPTLAGTRDALGARDTFFRKRPDFIGRDFLPQLAAFRPLPLADALGQRLSQLASEALSDLLARLPAQVPAPAVLFLCLPDAEAREGSAFGQLPPAHLARIERILRDVLHRHGFGETALERLSTGATGPVVALGRAHERSSRTGRPCIVLGVDSHATRPRLAALHEAGRLFDADNPWGKIPGEAAGALLVQAGDEARGDETCGDLTLGAIHARLSGLSLAHEPVTESCARDSLAEGMSAALQAAASAAPDVPGKLIGKVIANTDNSRYRAAELSYALHRLATATSAPLPDVVQPADLWGDIGTAFLCATVALQISAPHPERREATLLAIGGHSTHARAAALLS